MSSIIAELMREHVIQKIEISRPGRESFIYHVRIDCIRIYHVATDKRESRQKHTNDANWSRSFLRRHQSSSSSTSMSIESSTNGLRGRSFVCFIVSGR